LYRRNQSRQYQRNIPKANINRTGEYLLKKGVSEAYIFGSGLRKANPEHDLDIAVDLPPTAKNKRRFQDATDHGIDLFLLGDSDELFSTGMDDWLYTDEGDLQDLEDVKARKFSIPTEDKYLRTIEQALGYTIKDMQSNRELTFPIVENEIVGEYFVWVEPWHTVCLKNWKTRTVRKAEEKFLAWYEKEYPNKRIVFRKFIPENFEFEGDEGQALRHYGYTLIVSEKK